METRIELIKKRLAVRAAEVQTEQEVLAAAVEDSQLFADEFVRGAEEAAELEDHVCSELPPEAGEQGLPASGHFVQPAEQGVDAEASPGDSQAVEGDSGFSRTDRHDEGVLAEAQELGVGVIGREAHQQRQDGPA